MAKNNYVCDCKATNEELVKEVLGTMPSNVTFGALADFYKIIANDTRCKILYILSYHEMCVCDIANVLSMTKSAVSHQLNKMKEAGVVKSRRDGKGIYYSLDDQHIAGIFAITLEHINHKSQEA